MAQYRVGRLEQEIQKEVNDILLKRVRDPRVQGVTLTGVEVTGDLQQATIYYSILSDKPEDEETTAKGLEKAAGLIRVSLVIDSVFIRRLKSSSNWTHPFNMATRCIV